MKYLLPVFLFILFSLISNAQSLFDKKYLQPIAAQQLLVIDTLGNIYIAGTDNFSRNVIVKFDKYGNVIWDKLIWLDSANLGPFDMMITADQQLIIMGGIQTYNSGLGLIICMDTSGNIIYSNALGLTKEVYEPYSVIPDSDGYTVCATFYDSTGLINGDTKLIKFNNTGNIIYENMISGGVNAIRKCPDGSYGLFSSIQSAAGFDLARVDSNFMNPVGYFSEYDNLNNTLITDLQFINDTEAYIIGWADYPFIGHVDKNLKCDWIKQFLLDSTDGQYLVDMHQLTDKSWMFLGFSPDNIAPSTGNYFLLHTDSAFNPLGTKYLKSRCGFEDDLITRTALSDNDLLFAICHVDSVYPFLGSSFELIKTDTSFSNLCNERNTSVQVLNVTIDTLLPPTYGTSVSYPTQINPITLPVKDTIPVYGLCSDITLSVSEVAGYNEKINVFPNPVNGNQITFSYTALQAHAILAIINITGQEIAHYQLPQFGSVQNIKLPPMASGMYVARLITKDGAVSKRFVKE